MIAADSGPFRSARWFLTTRRHRFAILLGALVLLLFSMPLVRLLGPGLHPVLSRTIVTGLFTAMLLSAVFAVCQTRASVIVGLSLAVPAIFPQLLGLVFRYDGIVLTSHWLGIAFLVYTVIVILRFIFAGDRVTSETIWAALCVYLLLGVLWANVYSLVDFVEPDSFAFGLAEDQQTARMRFGGEESVFPIYYSFVTLSTLGYGDIVPKVSAARMLAAVEAITGQLYLAVLVARLVGLHISQSTPRVDRKD